MREREAGAGKGLHFPQSHRPGPRAGHIRLCDAQAKNPEEEKKLKQFKACLDYVSGAYDEAVRTARVCPPEAIPPQPARRSPGGGGMVQESFAHLDQHIDQQAAALRSGVRG
jgi:hypothetical protein